MLEGLVAAFGLDPAEVEEAREVDLCVVTSVGAEMLFITTSVVPPFAKA